MHSYSPVRRYVWRDVLAGAYVAGVSAMRRHIVNRETGEPVCDRVRAESLADVWSVDTPPCRRCLSWLRRTYSWNGLDPSNGMSNL